MSNRLELIRNQANRLAQSPITRDNVAKDLRVAVVHDWLVAFGGAERVLEQILTLFPQADLFTLCDFFEDEKRVHILNKRPTTSFIQRFPFARSKYRSYLPLMPMAIEQFDLTGYDLIISSSHAVAHGVLTTSDQLHISYINNTMVYAWDLYHHYLRSAGLHRGLRGLMAKAIMHYIRMWDAASVNRVDHYIANSEYMAGRIARLYGQKAPVIYPPVDVDRFELCREKEDYYVTVSRLVPFKRIDLIVKAFNHLPDKKLVVIGDGPEMKKLRTLAGDNISFTGFKDQAAINEYVKKARAFLFSSAEPFGIAVVEAQACGTPVIAYGRGAAQEIITDSETGIFFHRQDITELVDAIHRFDKIQHWFEPERIRANAMRFSVESFREQLGRYIGRAVADRFQNGIGPDETYFRSCPEKISAPII
jgi:glycosyltransferase involved in cell wall biosynthesis